MAASLEACGFSIRAQIIWAKDRLVLGRGHYHWQHEPAWYALRGQGHWAGDRKQTTLWQIPSRAQDATTVHGTQKPVECMRRPMENNSSPGQAVYEPFSGSGTTLIAAELTGRSCHAIELSPAYVDVSVLRWQAFTGQQAVLEGTGATFADTGGRVVTQGVRLDPTEEQRRIVKAMAGYGVPHEGIAVMMEMDAKTLRKYFGHELERGSIEATAKVGQSLFRMATEGNNVAAAIFWMKARAGWREKHELQVTTKRDVTQLTDAQLEQLVSDGFERWQDERRPVLVAIDSLEGQGDA